MIYPMVYFNGRNHHLCILLKWCRHFLKRFLFFGLLWVIMLNGNSMVAAQNNNRQMVIESDHQYEFADTYFRQGRYAEAILEFERFIHFFPDEQRVPKAYYRIGLSLLNSGRFKEAIDSFSTIIHRWYPSDLSMNSYFRMSECLMKIQDSGSAVRLLEHLAETAPSQIIRDEAYYRIGWIYLETGNFAKALESFQKIRRANWDRFRLNEITSELSKDNLFPQKKPLFAGALSIIPGAGFVYCERYQDALVAFLLNSAFIWSACESFDSGNDGLGSIITFVGTGFYLGNIYGAVSSAHKYNRASKKTFLENLKSRTAVTLSTVKEMPGLVLGVRYSF